MKTTNQEYQDRFIKFNTECKELCVKVINVMPLEDGKHFSKMDIMKSVLANAAVLKSLLQNICKEVGNNSNEELQITSVMDDLDALIAGFKIAVSHKIYEDLHSESEDS